MRERFPEQLAENMMKMEIFSKQLQHDKKKVEDFIYEDSWAMARETAIDLLKMCLWLDFT